MLPLLAGLGALALLGNPFKGRRAVKRRNPSAADRVAKVKHAARLWLSGKYGKTGAMEDALGEAGAPITEWARERMQDEIDDLSVRSNPRRKGRVTPGSAAARLAHWRWHHNPGRYARLDAKAVAKARLNIRSGGQPHTVWPAVRAQGAAARARRTMVYGAKSRLSKRIEQEYRKAVKAGKARRWGR